MTPNQTEVKAPIKDSHKSTMFEQPSNVQFLICYTIITLLDQDGFSLTDSSRISVNIDEDDDGVDNVKLKPWDRELSMMYESDLDPQEYTVSNSVRGV